MGCSIPDIEFETRRSYTGCSTCGGRCSETSARWAGGCTGAAKGIGYFAGVPWKYRQKLGRAPPIGRPKRLGAHGALRPGVLSGIRGADQTARGDPRQRHPRRPWRPGEHLPRGGAPAGGGTEGLPEPRRRRVVRGRARSLRQASPGGGPAGWKEPAAARHPFRVEEALRDGYLTAAQARAGYAAWIARPRTRKGRGPAALSEQPIGTWGLIGAEPGRPAPEPG